MEVGQVTESVEVSAQAALIDTRSSQTSATIDDRRIVDLPLRGRNVFSLAATLPGVLNVRAPDNSDVGDTRAGPTMNVNGGRANMNYNRFNGTYFNNPSRNTGMERATTGRGTGVQNSDQQLRGGQRAKPRGEHHRRQPAGDERDPRFGVGIPP